MVAFGLIALSLSVRDLHLQLTPHRHAILDGNLFGTSFSFSCVASFLLGFYSFFFYSSQRFICRNDSVTTH